MKATLSVKEAAPGSEPFLTIPARTEVRFQAVATFSGTARSAPLGPAQYTIYRCMDCSYQTLYCDEMLAHQAEAAKLRREYWTAQGFWRRLRGLWRNRHVRRRP